MQLNKLLTQNQSLSPVQSDSDGSEELQEKRAKDIAAERKGRHYKASLLPVFKTQLAEPGRTDILLALYNEVGNNWRMLTDVRFKLLGFVPTISVLALGTLLTRDAAANGLNLPMRAAICVFGLLITLGLFIYDQRNNMLYNDLTSRARRIEKELGLDTGQFLGRKDPANAIINHNNAVNLIYVTTLIGWLFALLAIVFGWAGFAR